jgi:D-glycero-D-manno-heptose 1,7-bisphosphate phosphatase
MTRRALILDRDGVINVDTGYLHRIEDCVFIDGIFELVQSFYQQGFAIIIATNQAGIGRGYYSEADFKLLMDWMCEQFAGKIEGVYHCPDHPEGVGVYRRQNSWRKPGPGMLLQAARDFNLDMARSWMIGDKETDVEAARGADVGQIVLLDPSTTVTVRSGDHWRVPNLAAVTALLYSHSI